jgi:hypothetical protein
VHKGNTGYDEEPLPYPSYSPDKLDGHKKAMLSRLKVVVTSFTNKRYLNLLINFIFLFEGNKIFATIKKTVLNQFMSWKLLKEKSDHIA